MNILFLSLDDFDTVNKKSIYSDLLRAFIRQGHIIYAISPCEARNNGQLKTIHENKCTILKVRIGNIQKTNIIEKGISMILLESQIKKAIQVYFNNIKFDLIIYPTPPITFSSVIKYIKRRDSAETYLLLKDIFPQNAIDLNMFRKISPIYTYFRTKEKELYQLSDYIGCMSQANVDYILKNNSNIVPEQIEVCPNSIEPIEVKIDNQEEIRRRYHLPSHCKIFVYGGNLGKPQGVDFICQCLKECSNIANAYFLIVGSGTEYNKLSDFIDAAGLKNTRLISQLPKEDYDMLVAACDVGLIFLDHRFTIPNFPSRLLSYMQAKMPVLACTDSNTDIGEVIETGRFGYWCESNSTVVFKNMVKKMCSESDLSNFGNNGWNYLLKHYTVDASYKTIMKHFEQGE